MSNVVFFDGVDDSVSMVNSASLNISGDITLEAIIKPDCGITLDYRTIIRKGPFPWNGSGAYALTIAPSLRTFFSVRKPTDDTYDVVGNIDGSKIPRNTLTTVTGTLTSDTLRLYINGNLIDTKVMAWAGILTNNGAGSIGSEYYSKLIYNARIYNRALSDSEVLYNWMHPNNPKRRGLVLNLTQDSIYGPTWLDLSGNANNGTYVGGAVPVTANRLAGR